MCRVLSVSPSGYYDWLEKLPSRRQQENEVLLIGVRAIHNESRKTYGSPRITAKLKAKGFKCSEKRVARIMRENNIKGIGKRRYKATTNSSHNMPIAKNLLNDELLINKPNQVWAADITYIPTGEGWLYLATIIDLFTRQVVGWSMADHMRKELVINAFKQALGRKFPPTGLIHHSDRGSQYASNDFQVLLSSHKVRCSMSGKGNYFDNDFAESFFATLKSELVYRNKSSTRKDAQKAIFEYIEVFYNNERLHSSLGYKSPREFEEGYFISWSLKKVA